MSGPAPWVISDEERRMTWEWEQREQSSPEAHE